MSLSLGSLKSNPTSFSLYNYNMYLLAVFFHESAASIDVKLQEFLHEQKAVKAVNIGPSRPDLIQSVCVQN